MAPAVERGSVVLLQLDPVRGHEQAGVRPCVVVSAPAVVQHQRFPLIAVVPLTRTAAPGMLYPMLPAGTASLKADSFVLTDQVRSVDKSRITRVFGRLDTVALKRVELGLRAFLGLE